MAQTAPNRHRDKSISRSVAQPSPSSKAVPRAEHPQHGPRDRRQDACILEAGFSPSRTLAARQRLGLAKPRPALRYVNTNVRLECKSASRSVFAVELDPRPHASPLVYHYPIKPEIVEKLKKDSPLTFRNTRVFQPHHSHRSEAQAAWHVVHAIHKEEGGPPKFYSLDNTPPHKERIVEIKINKQHVTAIRAELSKWV